jgi:hypothetical protein
MKGRITVILLLVFFLGGCVAPGQRAEKLLAIEHAALTDSELADYFQRLNGELAREKRLAREQRGSGLAGQEARQEALWGRWNEVRAEMSRRELLP